MICGLFANHSRYKGLIGCKGGGDVQWIGDGGHQRMQRSPELPLQPVKVQLGSGKAVISVVFSLGKWARWPSVRPPCPTIRRVTVYVGGAAAGTKSAVRSSYHESWSAQAAWSARQNHRSTQRTPSRAPRQRTGSTGWAGCVGSRGHGRNSPLPCHRQIKPKRRRYRLLVEIEHCITGKRRCERMAGAAGNHAAIGGHARFRVEPFAIKVPGVADKLTVTLPPSGR